MNSITVGAIVFACLFGGALLGTTLRVALPSSHLANDSKEAVKVGMGLVATMVALVLGLLVASAKSAYDAQSNELTQMSAKIVLLDRVLAHYGPETKEARDMVRNSTTRILDQGWSKQSNGGTQLDPRSAGGDIVYEKIQGLSPKDDRQRALQVQALQIGTSLAEMRWLMYEQETTSVSVPLLIAMVFWLTALFISFGLFAPRNETVVASFFIAALSVSGAIFLIVEMYTPYAGIIKISSAPLRFALAQLGA
ncbi:MAG: hypothetical protein WCA15_22055 [Candidatus Acidiferrales bacterium]